MARSSILPDELLRHLVAVGQVDVLVGVPTFNHAATIESLVKTLHVGLARHFPRERTVIVNPDGGSDDGTPDLVRRAPLSAEEMRGSPSLRTTHRVSAPHLGLPDRASGLRTVFAAADLLQARVVVVVDADVTSMTPDWVGALAKPIAGGSAELVLPVHPRHRVEGALIGQIVHPLLGTAFSRRIRSNLAGNFGISGGFASHLLTHDLWSRDPTRAEAEVHMLAAGLAQDLPITQAQLGPCLTVPRRGQTSLPELFRQVVGNTFDCLERHAEIWTVRGDPVDLPITGEPAQPAGPEPAIETAPMAERFRHGVRDLEPLLREILIPTTLARVLAVAGEEGPLRVPDPLWVSILDEFAGAAHRAIMSRDHLAGALVPLYLGRTASFFDEIGALDDATHASRLAAFECEFETQRPYLLERWNSQDRR